MSSSERISRRAALAGLLALAGCGFTPVHAPGAVGDRLRGAVHLPDPTDTDSYTLNAHLITRLGVERAPRYDLTYGLRVALVGQGITAEQVSSRYALNGTLDFRLTDRASGETLTEGAVSAFTSYSATGSTIATTTAEADARLRLMHMLGDLLVTRLLGTLPD